MLTKKFLLWAFSIILLLFFSFAIQASYEETIFVSMVIKTDTREIMRDYFFEILDMGDYILLPVNSLSSYLELRVTYKREENTLIIEHKPSSKIAEVNFEEKKYPEYPELAQEPPIQYEGEFFVSKFLLEKLADAEIDWNFRRQEVTIKVDRPIEEEIDEMERPRIPGEPIKLVPDIIGPDYSLGSIQYEIKGVARLQAEKDWNFSSIQNVNLHGRMENWAISLGVSSRYNFTDNVASLKFPLLRATSRGENYLLILGDSRIAFPETLKRQSLRGVYFQTPTFLTAQRVPLVTIKGYAEEGSFVRLYINRELQREQVAQEGRYNFPNVVLIPLRSNSIRVTIEKPDGSRDEIVKTMAAHPRLFQEGTTEVTLAGGVYGTIDKWDGNLLGAIYNQSISENLSLGMEVLRYQELTPAGYGAPQIGLVAGLTGRPLGNTILGLDILGGGFFEDMDYGVRASFLQAFSRGHFQSTYSLIGPEVSRTVEAIPGHRLNLLGNYTLSDQWSFKLEGDFRYSLPEMIYSTRYRGIIGVTYREGSRHSTTLSVTGGIRRIDLEINEDDFIRAEVVDGGFGIEHSRRSALFAGSFGLDYLASQLTLPGEEKIWEERVGLKGTISRSVTDSLRLDGGAKLETTWVERELHEGELELESNFRWTLGPQTFLTGKAVSEFTYLKGEFSEPEQGNTRAMLNLLHFFDYNTSLRLGTAYTWYPQINASILSANLSGTHFWADRRGSIRLDMELKSPIEPRENYQIEGGAIITWEFQSGLTGEVGVDRRFRTIYEEKPDYSVTIGISQTLGFASGNIVGQSYKDIRGHNGFIGGRVFLDLNGNGVYDEGEPLLANIPMVLGGRRGMTNEKGIFLFDNLFTGVYPLGFDETSLPVDYSIVTSEKVVELRDNENFFLDFGLTLNGVIAGRVFVDRNSSGTFDEGDEPLSFVGIYMETLDRVFYTRRDGSFYIENVPLGEHNIQIIQDTLPRFTSPGEKDEFSVEITMEQLAMENIMVPVIFDF